MKICAFCGKYADDTAHVFIVGSEKEVCKDCRHYFDILTGNDKQEQQHAVNYFGSFKVQDMQLKEILVPHQIPAPSRSPGERILKVIGILGIIVFGVSAPFIALSSIMVLSGAMIVEYGDNVMPTMAGFPWEIYYLFSAVSVGYGLYAYIMAFMYCAKLEKASFLKTLGTINVFVIVIIGIVDISAVGVSMLTVVTLPTRFVLPILYIHGASKNLKAYLSLGKREDIL